MDKQYFYIAGALGSAIWAHKKFSGDSYKTLLASIIGGASAYLIVGFTVQQYQLFKINQSLKK